MFRKLTVEERLQRERKRNLMRLNENVKRGIEQGIELSEREINEIVMGMQISDIEIGLLELKLGGM